jgi:putative N6-adenine-specific DNA methylase
MYQLFAVSAPGLEPFTAQELDRLVVSGSRLTSRPEYSAEEEERGEEAGGVAFQGSPRDIYRVNLHLRTASRVLIRLGAFYAAGFPELRRKARRLPWEDYLAPGKPVTLRVACHKSRLYHQAAVSERVAGAIADRLGRPAPVVKFEEDAGGNLPQLIVVRLAEDRCTMSIDSSGALLHRRGYRLATGKAPLRETLASGMLMASGWDRVSPLLDPFCGSGTIAIEAALLARQIPAGWNRRFAFMDWPSFDAEVWKTVLEEGKAAGPASSPNIMASDRDAGAVVTAQNNAKRAGVADGILFSCRSISAIEPPSGSGWVVTNPPYGVRVSRSRDLRNLYAEFGKVLRAKCPGWHVSLLCSSLQLLHSTGLEFSDTLSLVNGGLRVKLATGKVE